MAMHLQWLFDRQELFVRALVFEEVLAEHFRGELRARDVNESTERGVRWRQNADGSYRVTRLKAGRVVVTNFDPHALSDPERAALNERIERNPPSFVYLELQPDRPGGDLAIRGAIALRSIAEILEFVATGIHASPEYEVTPDPRTGTVRVNPDSALRILASEDAPPKEIDTIHYNGKYYSVAQTDWDLRSFWVLSALFQTSVGEVRSPGLPITIAK